jgi:hypothetical protein
MQICFEQACAPVVDAMQGRKPASCVCVSRSNTIPPQTVSKTRYFCCHCHLLLFVSNGRWMIFFHRDVACHKHLAFGEVDIRVPFLISHCCFIVVYAGVDSKKESRRQATQYGCKSNHVILLLLLMVWVSCFV